MNTCRHVQKIRPSSNHSILNPQKWKCIVCSATENIWACLSCAHVGCGKYLEEHIKHHYNATKHPLSMNVHEKFIFCYDCDDYILNDNTSGDIKILRNCLQAITTSILSLNSFKNKLSLSVSSSTSLATDEQINSSCRRSSRVHKSNSSTIVSLLKVSPRTLISENNEDVAHTELWFRRYYLLAHFFNNWKSNSSKLQNLSIESSINETMDEDEEDDLYSSNKKTNSGKRTRSSMTSISNLQAAKRRRHSIPGATGLQNLGNTCYMNSILQVLRHLYQFSKAFIDEGNSNTEKDSQKNASDIQKDESQISNNMPLNETQLNKNVTVSNSNFISMPSNCIANKEEVILNNINKNIIKAVKTSINNVEDSNKLFANENMALRDESSNCLPLNIFTNSNIVDINTHSKNGVNNNIEFSKKLQKMDHINSLYIEPNCLNNVNFTVLKTKPNVNSFNGNHNGFINTNVEIIDENTDTSSFKFNKIKCETSLNISPNSKINLSPRNSLQKSPKNLIANTNSDLNVIAIITPRQSSTKNCLSLPDNVVAVEATALGINQEELIAASCDQVVLNANHNTNSASTVVLRKKSSRKRTPTKLSLSHELNSLLRIMWSGKMTMVSPHKMLYAVWNIIPFFRGYSQQDAQEFLSEFLDKVQSEMDSDGTKQTNLRLLNGSASSSASSTTENNVNGAVSKRNYEDIVTQLFQGELISQVKCLTCGYESNIKEAFMDLSLEFPMRFHSRTTNKLNKVCRLEEMLTQFMQIEKLEGLIYACEECNKPIDLIPAKTVYTEAEKRFLINKLPHVLRLHLKRFMWSGRSSRGKIGVNVAFPHSLDVSSFCHEDVKADSFIYNLSAVVMHHGRGFGSGHYTAYCWNNDADSWLHCNDAKMQKASLEDVHKAQAYILVYTKLTSMMPSPCTTSSTLKNSKKNSSDNFKSPKSPLKLNSRIPKFSDIGRLQRSDGQGVYAMKRTKTTIW